MEWFAKAGGLMISQRRLLVVACVPYSALLEIATESRDRGTIDLVSEIANVPELLRTERYEQLTKSELVVLDALASGATQHKIGELLFIAENTVKFHIRNIYRKLKVSGRVEAIEQAVQRRLVSRVKDQ